MEARLEYAPESGERWPFLGARLDLCGQRCLRPNVSVQLQLEAQSAAAKQAQRREQGANSSAWPQLQPQPQLQPPAPSPSPFGSFHCDRDPYTMVSKRRLCGKFLASSATNLGKGANLSLIERPSARLALAARASCVAPKGEIFEFWARSQLVSSEAVWIQPSGQPASQPNERARERVNKRVHRRADLGAHRSAKSKWECGFW